MQRRREQAAARAEDAEARRRREAEAALRARLEIRTADGFFLSTEKVCGARACAYARVLVLVRARA